MWIKCKGKDLFIKVKAVGVITENKRLYSIVGSVTGNEYEGVVLGKFRNEDTAKRCVKGFENAIQNGEGLFDINKYKNA